VCHSKFSANRFPATFVTLTIVNARFGRPANTKPSVDAPIRRMEGRVASASRGTLFLDEVGELPLAVQAKLLQLLHAKRFYPLGSTKPEIAVWAHGSW